LKAGGFGCFDSDVVAEVEFHLQDQDLVGYLCGAGDIQDRLVKLRLLELMLLDVHFVLGSRYEEVARELR